MSAWRTYPDGDHPLDRLMAAFERRGVAAAVWHDYGEGSPFHGIELGRTLIKVSGEAHSIHDRWWDASGLPIEMLDPDDVLADPDGVAARLPGGTSPAPTDALAASFPTAVPTGTSPAAASPTDGLPASPADIGGPR